VVTLRLLALHAHFSLENTPLFSFLFHQHFSKKNII